ncbi:MAG: cache domain-containing protein [Mycobacterium leprae]
MTRFSLNAKLILSLTLVALLPLATLVGVTYHLQQSIQRDTEQKVDSTLELGMNLEQNLITRHLLSMEHVASAVAVDPGLLADAAAGEGQPDLAAYGRIFPGADMLLVVDRKGAVLARSTSNQRGDSFLLGGLVTAAIQQNKSLAYPSIIEADELKNEGPQIRELVDMPILKTNQSSDPRFGGRVSSALALVAVYPIHGADGSVVGAAVAADVLNRDFGIVDEVAQGSPRGMPLNATIAMDGIRVTTNVRLADPEGNKTEERALGTIYSDVVMKALRANQEYRGRAPVVGQWQRTIYRPLLNYQGQVIGGPYVGIPEDYFTKNAVDLFLWTWYTIAGLAALLIVLIGLVMLWIRRHLRTAAKAVREATGGLGAAASSTAAEADNVLAAIQESAEAMQQVQVGAAGTVAWLRELEGAVSALSDGARHQERSVQYTGKVAAEMAAALDGSRVTVEQTLKSAHKLMGNARDGLKRVAEFTAGIALLKNRLSPQDQQALLLLQDPSELLLSLANEAERIVTEVRLLALTIQENEARLGFIHEEMARVGGVVEGTADSMQRAGQGARVVIGQMEQMAAAAEGVGNHVQQAQEALLAVVQVSGEVAAEAERVKALVAGLSGERT